MFYNEFTPIFIMPPSWLTGGLQLLVFHTASSTNGRPGQPGRSSCKPPAQAFVKCDLQSTKFPTLTEGTAPKAWPQFYLIAVIRLSLICMLGFVCFLYNAKGKLKVRRFRGMFGPKQRPVFLFIVCRLHPLMLPPVLFWWSTKLSAADVSPTQWKHSLMDLGTSRFCSYGKRKSQTERMNLWIGLISF